MADKTERKYSKLCTRCTKKCKQAEAVQVISCPRFVRLPVQMVIPLFPPGRPRKSKSQ
jgi:hypothetical protein